MTVSVCMAMHNGRKYIETQLKSILSQTYQPDEVVLYDDGSEDGTLEIVCDFLQKHDLQMHWKLYTGHENKGYPACFYYAMGLCTKDIVFLADQDDIWDAEKIEKMRRVFGENSEVQALACEFRLVDGKGERIDSIMAPTHSKGTGRLRMVTIRDVFRKCEWPGMVMAYRREWYQGWARNHDRIPHDFLISARAAEEKGFFQLDEELASHRIHDDNTGNEEHRMKRLLNKGRKMQEIEEYIQYLDLFTEDDALLTEEGRSVLTQKRKTMHARYDALASGKISRVLKSVMENRENVRLATVICDVLICRQKIAPAIGGETAENDT